MAELLRVEGLKSGYGEAVVVQGVDLVLDAGQSLALLGRNGTGKTTLLNTLVGVDAAPRRDASCSPGRTSPRCRRTSRAAAGIGWVPQERNIFKSLTVDENLTAVARPGPWTVARAYEMFPRLAERRAQPRQPALRRRAADARRGARAGAQPEAAAARRAARGPGADHRRGTAALDRARGARRGHVGHHRRAEPAPDPADHAARRGAGPRPVVHEASSEALLADPARLEQLAGGDEPERRCAASGR